MAANTEINKFDCIVVGGGIAGVTCAEYLSHLNNDKSFCLISSTSLVKSVSIVRKIGRTLEEIKVSEKQLDSVANASGNVAVVRATVVGFDPAAHKVVTSDKMEYQYKKLCICTGARPKLIAEDNEHVLGLRDLQTIEYFQKRLSSARRVVIVGNGGIAMELVYELTGCEVVWVIKDNAIGNVYFDKGAAQFFLTSLPVDEKLHQEECTLKKTGLCERFLPEVTGGKKNFAAALGSNWKDNLNWTQDKSGHEKHKNVVIKYNSEIKRIFTKQKYYHHKTYHNKRTLLSDDDWNIYVELTTGEIYGCDFVVSATGVVPNTEPFVKGSEIKVADDGGLVVDQFMRTNVKDIYAAGDVCNASWEHSAYWMQMRLWTQANQMGAYAAKCMTADMDNCENVMDFCFEMFAHVTSFFGYQVIMLGKYNGQGLGRDYEVLLRCTKGHEYVKVVLHRGRIHGALLIGKTDLEETFENLILNQMDVSSFGEQLLDPNIDIEDYFD